MQGSLRIMVVGSGGREHALAWRLRRCESVRDVVVAPGNPGTGGHIPAASPRDFLQLAAARDVDLTVVGPEVTLTDGIADLFRAAGRLIVGPTQAAARLEGSKAFSKAFMDRHSIPTAGYIVADGPTEARLAIERFGFPIVLKADGLAAGKGVVIAQDRSEVEAALAAPLAGSRLVVEEFLQGDEVSFIVLTDGVRFVNLEPACDHKAVRDGDEGPNTGGMGAYSEPGILTAAERAQVEATVIEPALRGMREEGTPFAGFLYAGLMRTANGPRVLEFNARLGDPETQALLYRLHGDFAQLLLSAARSELDQNCISWSTDAAVCIVLAAEGYPGTVRQGDPITGLEAAEAEGASVFHAGTRRMPQGLVTGGGRVLGVTAAGADLQAALDNAYRAVGHIHFEGMHYRRDIGMRERRLRT